MSLTSANVSYPPHVRMRQHQQQQQPYPHPYPHHSDISPTMSHESVSSNHSSSPPPASPPVESSHPLYISTSHSSSHHQQQASYHYGPYQAPSPPYSHPHRSNSIELAQKPSLPYPTRHSQHTYSTPSHRNHPYPPPTLPPLTGRPPLSPQSPIDSTPHYPVSNSNHDDRHHYRTESPMSASPPPSSASGSSNGSQHQGSDAAAGGIPLSANDRRERNKAASAKYRAKKHYQSGEMRTQITTLQDHNNVLTRQLEECRTENTSLKNLVEKLKGRLVAEKVLKRLREVGREKKRRRGGATNVSAHDLSMSDSDTDDVVDAVGDDDVVVHDEDEDNFDDEERVEIQRRQRERKSTTRRRVARPDDDDEDYHDS